jgi:nucleoid DNA-binding protein
MNRLDLIETLGKENRLSRNEASTVAKTFFDEIGNALAKGDRAEIRGLFSFYVKNIRLTPEEILKPVKRSKSSQRNWPFLNVVRS